MPTSLVKAIAKDKGKSVDAIEKMWASAKAQAGSAKAKNGKSLSKVGQYKYATYVLLRMNGYKQGESPSQHENFSPSQVFVDRWDQWYNN